MRDAGKAVLLVSVELDEIRSLSDRILVMFAGRVVGERGPEATRGRTRPSDGRRRAQGGGGVKTPALLVIDVQNAIDDPVWGRRGQPQMEAVIVELLAAWRERRLPVVHIRHELDRFSFAL